jgi:hypothetical protein
VSRRRPCAVALLALAALLVAAEGRPASLLDDLDRSDREAREAAHAVTIAALGGDVRALRAATDRLATLDAHRREAHRPPTGLHDEAELLVIGTLPTPAARRTPLDDFIAHSSGDAQRVARGLAASDGATRATRLLADDRHDRRAALINDAVRPFGLGTNLLAVVNPVLLAGSALDAIVATTRNVLHYDRLTTRERDALATYRAAVARNAGSERSPDLARDSQQLSEKRRAALCKEALRQAKTELEAGALPRAATRLRSAGALDDCDTTTLDGRLTDAERAAAAARDAAIWPQSEAALPRTPAEEIAWRRLAVAVVQADPAGIDAAADDVRRLDDDGPLVPGAELSHALACDLRGQRTRARETLEDLEDDDTPVGQYAAGVVAGPGYGDADALAAAERRHRNAVARYVALGGATGTAALHGAAQLAAYGASGAQSLGITNAIGLLVRAYRAWRHDPAPNDAVITRGETYLAWHPDASDRDDVHAQLARAYERAERYDRALLHVRAMSAPDPDEIAGLEDKLADEMLTRARQSEADPALLTAIATQLPGTDAAETARKALEKRREQGDLTITREQLERHLDLVGPEGLDLTPGLLDGDEANGELASDGMTLRGNVLELHLEPEHDGKAQLERRTLDDAAAPQMYAAAETLLYREALARDERTEERGRLEDYMPFFVTGTFGDSGINMYPGIKLRPYDDAHAERYR